MIKKNGSYVYKDYVITPCTNIENNKISWWLTKVGYVIAIYAFSTNGHCYDTTEKGIEEHIKATIPLYEEYLRRLSNAK